jgi:photosystem II stability/assembly factor-like uncharacterized protein
MNQRSKKRSACRGRERVTWNTLLPILVATLALRTVSAGANEWTNIGPQGGSVQYLAVDPQDPTTVYAATGVGVYKSKDAGETWSNTGLTGYAVGGLFIDPQTPGTLNAWTPGGYDGNGRFVGTYLFRSTDGAATWNQVNSPLPAKCCSLVLFSPRDASAIYVLAGSPGADLFKSLDGGASWAQGSTFPNQSSIVTLAIDPQDAGALYAGTMGVDSAHHNVAAVFKSTDGGTSWSAAGSGLPGSDTANAGFAFSAFAFDPGSPGTVYVSEVGNGVYKSTNAGANWRPANSGMPTYNPPDFRSCCVSAVAIDPQDSNTLYVPSRNGVIFKSTNGGTSWNALNAVLPPPYTLQPGPGANVLAIDPRNTSTLYVATQLGLSRSTDGGVTWRTANLRAVPISSLAINPRTPSFVYAGNLLSTDAGNTWFAVGYKVLYGIDALAIDPRTPTNVYAGSGDCEDGLSIFRSADGGQSWTDTRAGAGCVSTIAIDPQMPSTVYAGSQDGRGVYKSADGGTSWSALNTRPSSGSDASVINALAIDPQSTKTIYAGGPGGIFKTTDGGASWIAVNSGLTGLSVNTLAVDPNNTATVYAGTDGGLWKSTDGAASWRRIFPSSSAGVYAIAINPQMPGTIYAGTDSGVARSEDGGARWAPIPGGAENVRLLALDPQDPNTLFAGGPGGLFVISLNPSRRDRPARPRE